MFKAPTEPDKNTFFSCEDRFRRVELAISFKKIVCSACGFGAIYKFHVQQIRRLQEIRTNEDQEIRPDHIEIWQTIPRFAEIPETVRCKHCKETLSPDILCVY